MNLTRSWRYRWNTNNFPLDRVELDRFFEKSIAIVIYNFIIKYLICVFLFITAAVSFFCLILQFLCLVQFVERAICCTPSLFSLLLLTLSHNDVAQEFYIPALHLNCISVSRHSRSIKTTFCVIATRVCINEVTQDAFRDFLTVWCLCSTSDVSNNNSLLINNEINNREVL